jgi:hypothetical protein
VAEASVQIPTAPAAATPAPSAGLKILTVLNPDGTTVIVQGIALLDSYGKPIDPLTEATGQRICQLLEALISLQQQATGGFVNIPESPLNPEALLR